MGDPRILLVVATLGERIDFLRETLTSIGAQSVPSDVVIVAPVGIPQAAELVEEFATSFLPIRAALRPRSTSAWELRHATMSSSTGSTTTICWSRDPSKPRSGR